MIRPLFAIFTCLALGNFIKDVLGLPLPGSIIGLFFMLILLKSGFIKLETMEATSNLLLNNLGLFFIPPTVGVMAYWADISPNIWPIAVSVVLSTFAVLLATGFVHQLIRRLT